jgi:hypothetical protein
MALALVFFVGLTLFYFLPLASGLIVRQVFNELSGAASAGFNLWTLFTLLVDVAVLNQLAVTTAVTAETSMHIIIETLLRKNLLSRILEYPGARPLPMTDTPPAPPRRRRGAPLRNLNALKHRISRQRPANTA